MASIAQKLLILLLVFSPCFLPWGSLQAASRTSLASRQWVVKLRQNSWMNRRPFQFATPVVDGDRVFVGVHRGFFYAVDSRRGKKIWTFKTHGPVHARAFVGEQIVYFADTKGVVYALEKSSGKPLWISEVSGEILSAPLALNGKLFVVTLARELVALDLASGNLLWRVAQKGRDSGFSVRGSSDPVFAGGHILVGYSDGALVAHAQQNGEVRWVKHLGDTSEPLHDVDSTILVAGRLAYVSSADGKLFALDPVSGQIFWQAPIGGVNDAVLREPFLYVTARGIVYSLKSDNGETVWEQDLAVPEISSPAIEGSLLAVVATKGKIYFLNRENGNIQNTWYVKGGSYSDPVTRGNQLFLLSNAGRLYSFKLR